MCVLSQPGGLSILNGSLVLKQREKIVWLSLAYLRSCVVQSILARGKAEVWSGSSATIALWEPFCFSVEANEPVVSGHYSSALRFLDVVYLGNSTVSLMARCWNVIRVWGSHSLVRGWEKEALLCSPCLWLLRGSHLSPCFLLALSGKSSAKKKCHITGNT